MKLIFLHGLPGVGKLTVARELETLTGFRVFHNHLTVDLVQSVFEFGSQPFIDLREKIWLEVFSRAVEAKLDGLIFTFVFERTVGSSFIASVRRAVESNGGEVHFVELQCSPSVLEGRITDPSRHGFGKLTSLELFRQLREAGAFDDSGAPADRLVVNTTEVSAREAARLIAMKLA